METPLIDLSKIYPDYYQLHETDRISLIKIEFPSEISVYSHPDFYRDHPKHQSFFIDRLYISNKEIPRNISFQIIIQMPIFSDEIYYPYTVHISEFNIINLFEVIYYFYFNKIIDQDFIKCQNIPYNSGNWYRYLQYTGHYIDRIEPIDNDEFILHFRKDGDRQYNLVDSSAQTIDPISNDLNSTSQMNRFSCKKCNYFHIKDTDYCHGCKIKLESNQKRYYDLQPNVQNEVINYNKNECSRVTPVVDVIKTGEDKLSEKKYVPSYLCKKCYTLHIEDLPKCRKCKTVLTENMKKRF